MWGVDSMALVLGDLILKPENRTEQNMLVVHWLVVPGQWRSEFGDGKGQDGSGRAFQGHIPEIGRIVGF